MGRDSNEGGPQAKSQSAHVRRPAHLHVSGLSHSGALPGNENKGMSADSEKANSVRSFGVVRSLAWVALVLTILLSIAVSIYLGNTSSDTLIAKNHRFATLLADYLNNQIYRRFTLPTISIFGRIALRNPEQYRQLDLIIKSIIQGLHVENLRIYAKDHTITYSMQASELGKSDDTPASVDAALLSNQPIFDLDAAIPHSRAFFRFSLEPNTFRLRTTSPLRMEGLLGVSLSNEEPVMGILEFSQDVTSDIESAIHFQQLILAVTLMGSGMLMVLLLLLVRRAEHALAIRMTAEQRLLFELHQHEKLAGMGRVVASIAHEIRNPLGIISSSAELLIKRAAKTDPGTSRILQAIYDEARRLSRTVSDFLDYARPKQLKPEQVDAGAIISQALAFLSADFASKDIGVVRSGEIDAPLWMTGDKDLLYRAFYNIMSNAVQAMGASGTLTIHISCTQKPAPVVHLLFQDTGPGFPEENMHQLLDPFFTTKEGGTGLGLPIVNSIISSHGGTLALTNVPDGGAQVSVSLPGAGADRVTPS